MPRGRPRKVPEEPLTNVEEEVAKVLAAYCGIPGCIARNHAEEAKRVVEIVKSKVS